MSGEEEEGVYIIERWIEVERECKTNENRSVNVQDSNSGQGSLILSRATPKPLSHAPRKPVTGMRNEPIHTPSNLTNKPNTIFIDT